MTVISTGYLSTQAVGDRKACKALMIEMEQYLQPEFGNATSESPGAFGLALLPDETEFAWWEISDERLAMSVIGGRFPCVLLRFAYNTEKVSHSQIQEIEQRFSLHLVAQRKHTGRTSPID